MILFRGIQCPLLAQSGHPDALNQCPLFGGKADIGQTYGTVRLLPKAEVTRAILLLP
jgi:hypothetical protein